MSDLLEFRHVSYSYHSIGGETTALSDISFTLTAGVSCDCRAKRLWKIHTVKYDLPSGTARAGGDIVSGRTTVQRIGLFDRIYAAEGSFIRLAQY